MMRYTLRLIPALILVAAVATLAHAQGTATSSLSGTIVDASGSVIPGASVVARNIATGVESQAVTGPQGTFTIPALNAGTYTVTISLAGFKTAVLNNVKLDAAVPAQVRASLALGSLEETVTVEGAAVVQTQSTAVATTIDVNQISNLPLSSRNTLDFVTLLPGVMTPGQNRDSTVNGLPQGTINITVDGVNVQDNTLRTTDGFFAIVSPRLDAVEEVTLASAAQGAEAVGQGAVQISFVTRSGTNEYHGSLYESFRHQSLNANTFFNNRNGLDRPKVTQHQPGFRLGGPIVIPGILDGHNKAFFFVNYEQFRQPTDVARDRIVLSTAAQQGLFRYNTAGGVQTVNLLALAAANGQISTMDPTIAKLLADIRNSTSQGSLTDLTDPLVQRLSFQSSSKAINHYPTVRLDFNLSSKHRIWATYTHHLFDSYPDTLNNRDALFPGFPVQAGQSSERILMQGTLRSVLKPTLVNQLLVFGGSSAPVDFFKELNPGLWGGTSVGDQGGYYLNLGQACCGTGVALTNASGAATPQSRNATSKVIEDRLSWVKGSHNFQLGFSATQYEIWLKNQTLVPELRFGVSANDPASALFTPANFPGASAANLAAAQGLYAILTGRVTQVLGNARINEQTGQFEYLGLGTQRARMREMDLFAQDSWRLRPTLTFNLGLRYALQLPFEPLNSSYSTATLEDVFGVSGVGNLFKPGTLAGRKPVFTNYAEGQKAYGIDWNNLAPSVGIAWQPRADSGLFHKLFGNQGDSVIRAAYSMAYSRQGLADFTNVFGANPGVTITANRTEALGNLGTLPMLLRDRSRLSPPSIPTSLTYPYSDLVTEDVNIMDPGLEVPYAQTWTLGFERALAKGMSVRANYVGTRFLQGWVNYDYNEYNIVENGFLNEFRLAQQNLQANIAAGRGGNFRYYGPGTGTSPLPNILAYFSGANRSLAGDPALYSSALFTNTTFLNPLARYNPDPFAFARSLNNDAGRRANALLAGLPPNFFVVNPDLLGGAFVTGNGSFTRYDGLELVLNRRYANGFQFSFNYAFGKGYDSTRYSFRLPRSKTLQTGGEATLTHALKGNWIIDLPFGQGRRFASNAGGLLDRIIGGWSLGGTAFVNSGRLLDFGNVRLVGFTRDDLKKMYKLRVAENGRIYMLPQDVIDNTVKAFSVSATSPTGYGQLGPPSGRYFAPANGPDCIENSPGSGECGGRSVVVSGPMFSRFDLSLIKRIRLNKKLNMEFRAEMLNAFNHPNFIPVTGVGSNPDAFEVTSVQSPSTNRGNEFDSARVVQLVTRINW